MANEVQEEVDKLIARTFDDPHYIYYHVNGYVDYKSDNTSNWYKEEYVSIDSKGKIIGHFYARIDRNTRGVTSIGAINFENGGSPVFPLDFRRFIEKLFVERNYYRISFCAITKNPIIAMYDRFMRDYNGREVGTFTRSERLSDGRLYDCKHYEMFREDYIKVKRRRDAMNNDSNSTSELDGNTRRHKPIPSI